LCKAFARNYFSDYLCTACTFVKVNARHRSKLLIIFFCELKNPLCDWTDRV